MTNSIELHDHIVSTQEEKEGLMDGKVQFLDGGKHDNTEAKQKTEESGSQFEVGTHISPLKQFGKW